MENKLIIGEQAIKTLRDEIAIAAMREIIIIADHSKADEHDIARSSYRIADAMLEARKEKDNA